MLKHIGKIKYRVIFGLLVLSGLIFFIVTQVYAKGGKILGKEYKESGTAYDYTTEYDFAKKADTSRWAALNPSDLIGNYMYMNYCLWPNISTIDLSHAYCLGHGNTSNTAVQSQYSGLYKVENIWDVDMDASANPGTSKAYNVEDDNQTFKVSGTVGKILTKWSYIANKTQTQTTRSAYYPNGGSIAEKNVVTYIYNNRTTLRNNLALSKKIGILEEKQNVATYANFIEDSAITNYCKKIENYKFSKASTTKTAKAEQKTVNGTTYTYMGPYAITSSFVKNEDVITGITATAGSTKYTVSGWAASLGGTIRTDYDTLSNPDKQYSETKKSYQSEFYIVIKGTIPANTTVKMKVNKKFELIKSRTMFLRNSLSSASGQNLIIYSAYPVTKNYSLEFTITTDEDTGKLKIVKSDANTKKVLAGAKFKIQLENGKYINTKKSSDGKYEYTGDAASKAKATEMQVNSSGTLEVSNLKSGYYLVYETQAPSGYVTANDPVRIWVNSDSRLKQLYNNNLEYALKCIYDSYTNQNPTFIQVYNQVFGTTATTDAIIPKGSDMRKKLATEKENRNFDKMTVANKRLFYLHFITANYGTSKIAYSGLTNKTLNDINAAGETSTEKKNYLKAFHKKVLNADLVEAYIVVYCARSKGYSSTLYKNKQKGNLKVFKADKDNKTVALKGAKFVVKNSSGKYIKGSTTVSGNGIYNAAGVGDTNVSSGTTFVTNEEGFFEIRGLTPGKYTVIETQAPAGYEFDNDENEFVINVLPRNYYSAEDLLKNQLKTMFNSNKKSDKYADEDNAVASSILLANKNVNLKKESKEEMVDSVFASYSSNNISIDGTKTTLKGLETIIDKVMSSTATSQEESTLEKYLAKVYTAYTGYNRTTEHINNATYYARATGYHNAKAIVNSKQEPDYGDIILYKTDESTKEKSLEGAKFNLLEKGVKVSAKKVSDGVYDALQSGGVTEFVTNKDGYLKIVNLDIKGYYALKEIEAPAGYTIKNDSNVSVTALNKDAYEENQELKYLRDSLAKMFWNISTNIDSQKLIRAVHINSSNSVMESAITNYVFGSKKLTSYAQIKEAVTYLLEDLSQNIAMKYDGKNVVVSKTHVNGKYCLIDAIQAVRNNKTVGKFNKTTGESFLKQYIAQVYNAYTGYSRAIENKYNLKYYQIAVGNTAVVMTNIENGTWLRLKKIDAETKSGINGINFIIKRKSDGKYVYSQNNKWAFTDSEAKAKIFKTQKINEEDGMLEIEGLEAGEYIVIEHDTGNTGYALPENNEHEIKIEENKVNKLGPIENTRTKHELPKIEKQLKLSGKVWMDIPEFDSNKNENKINHKYDEGKDHLLSGITVKFEKYTYGNNTSSEKPLSTVTDANGNYTFNLDLTDLIEQVKETDEVEKYKKEIENLNVLKYEEKYEELCKKYKEAFEKAYKQLLGQYLEEHYVSFEYDGVEYTNIHKGTDSVAAETETERSNFNKDFETITGEGQNIRNQTVKYDTTEAENIHITNNYKINAVTDKDCLENRYNTLSKNNSTEVTEITEINLGLYERAMPELALTKDIYKAEVTVNEKQYTYRYDKKYSDSSVETTPGVVFGKNIQLDESDKYRTPIYRADVNNADGKPYSFNVMYKIGILNASTELSNKVSKIEEYFSKDYEFEGVYDENENKLNSVNVSSVQETGEYKHLTLSGLDMTVAPKGEKYIYIKFNLPLDKLKSIFTHNTASGIQDVDLYDLYNTAEISTYSTYSNEECTVPYAGFDTNSIPNNYNRSYNGHNPKEENDTNKAPGLRIVEDVERSLKGIVFEDKAVNDDGVGNGYYDDGEELIKGVTVTATNKTNGEKRVAITGDDGSYSIEGVVPGTYEVTFEWGNSQNSPIKYDALRYKSTIVSGNAYSATDKKYSVAIDSYQNRMDVDTSTLNKITYDDMEEDNPVVTNLMTSKAINDVVIDNNMEAGGASYREDENGYRTYYYNIEGLNFGIIERPKQSMKITKELSYIKLVSGNQTLVESKVVDGKLENPDVNYTVYLPKSESNQYGTVKAELDNSLFPIKVYVQYTIKVENNSQKDYYKEGDLSDYYKYGVVGANDIPVKLKAKAVYDYISEAFGIDKVKQDDVEKTFEIKTSGEYESVEKTVIEKGYELLSTYLTTNHETITNYKWAKDKVDIKEIFEQWFSSENTTESVRTKKISNKKIVELTDALSVELEAGSSKEVTMDAEAELASNADEITLQNDAEITEIERTTNYGRLPFETYTTLYDRGEEIKITPPTGENKNYTAIILISVASIVILGVGIIIIKKKVLNK